MCRYLSLLVVALLLVASGVSISPFPSGIVRADSPTSANPHQAEPGESDWLTPEGWNIEACAYPGGSGLFRGKIYNATPNTVGQNVGLWAAGLGGLSTTVTPDSIAQTLYGERFDISLTVQVPSAAASGTYTGTLYAEGTGTNRMQLPLTLAVLTAGSNCTEGQLVLDGGDDYAESEDHSELDVGDEEGESLTIEAWVSFLTFPSTSAQVISKTNAYSLTIFSEATGGLVFRNLEFGLWIGNLYRWVQYGTAITGGFWTPGWYHLAGVYDKPAGEMRLYMDGQLRETFGGIGQGAVNNTSAPLRVGGKLAGVVEDVRVSAAALYSGSSYQVPSAPLACDGQTRALWHFDEANGATAFHDACGTDNLLVGYNGARTGGVPALPARAYLPLLTRGASGW